MLKAIQTKEPSLEPFTLDDEIRCYHLSKQLISGFNMHWKKAKPSQYAIASSSYILLKSSQNTPVDQMIQIGQKKNEGFGVIHFIPFEKSCELKLDEPSEKNEIGNEVITSPIFLALKQKELAIDYFNDHKNNLIQMNHALLGRMIMMLIMKKNGNKNHLVILTVNYVIMLNICVMILLFAYYSRIFSVI